MKSFARLSIHRPPRIALLLLITTATIGITSTAQRAPRAEGALSYAVVDLGYPAGLPILRPAALNRSGVIVGTVAAKTGPGRAFRIDPIRNGSETPVWFQDANTDGSNDLITELGGLGGASSSASDINEAGDVVGQARTRSGDNRAVMWRNGGILDLTRKNISNGAGINDLPSPQVVGTVYVKTSSKPYVWQNGSYTLIGNFLASKVNNKGQVTGQGAGLWSDGTLYTITPEGNPRTEGRNINEAGQVVGEVSDGTRTYPFLWTPHVTNGTTGTCLDLGTFGGRLGRAYGINNQGQVVGSSLDAAGNSRAFLWLGGSMVDLNTLISDPSWFLRSAEAINDDGLIVGTGSRDGVSAGFLLIPNP